jgi:hypothetical protein
MRVGLDVARVATEHFADRIARVCLGLYSKKTWSRSASTTKKCPFRQDCRPHRRAAPVGSERWSRPSTDRTPSLSLCGSNHDRAERRADVFSAPAHPSAVERHILTAKVLLLSIQRKPKSVFAIKTLRHHRGRQQTAANDFSRQADGFDCVSPVDSSVSLLVARATTANWTAPTVAETAALLERYSLRSTFFGHVEQLDAFLRQLDLAKIAPPVW